LIKINKKEKRETLDFVAYLLTEMRNILANPINNLILRVLKNDLDCEENISKLQDIKKISNRKKIKKKSLRELNSNLKENTNNNNFEDYTKLEIFIITNEKFIYLLKTLSKISHEYLVNLYTSMPLNNNFIKTNIRKTTFFEIFCNLIKKYNSIYIAENYEKLFNFFLNLIYNKEIREIEKFKIFCSLIKFNYKNSKEKLKKSGLRFLTYNIIIKFLDELKNENLILSVLNFIKLKILKGKKISSKISKKLINTFLISKNKKIFEALIKHNLEIIQKKLIIHSSNFDLMSLDLKRKIEKNLYLLKEILIKFNQYEENNKEYASLFEFNFMQFLIQTIQILVKIKNFESYKEGNLEVILKIFFILSFDKKTYNILLKYFISCIEANKKTKNLLFELNYYTTNNNHNVIFQNNFNENEREIRIIEFENRFFEQNNLNIFDKIEILFHNRIKLNNSKPNESELTAIFLDDFSKEKLKNNFFNLFCYNNSDDFCLEKRLDNLESILRYSDDKLLFYFKNFFLHKRLKGKGNNNYDKKSIIEENLIYSSNEEDGISLGNSSENLIENELLRKKSKNKNLELNLEISNKYKYNMNDINIILKAFFFEFETEDISLLEKLGEFFINDIDRLNLESRIVKINSEKFNLSNIINEKSNIKIIEKNNKNDNHVKITNNYINIDSNQIHLLYLLKSILTYFYFYIKNISFPLNISHKKINDLNNLEEEKIEMKYKLIGREGLILQIKDFLKLILNFLKKILLNKINQEDVVNLIIIISKSIFSLDEENLKNLVLNFVKTELTEFCFIYSENSIKNLADFFLKINRKEQFYYIPEKIHNYSSSEEYNLSALKFINYLLKKELENFEQIKKLKFSNDVSSNYDNNLEKLRSLVFNSGIIDYIDKNLSQFITNIDYKKEIVFVNINELSIRNELTQKFQKMILLKIEVYKLYLNYLTFKKEQRSLNNVNSEIFNLFPNLNNFLNDNFQKKHKKNEPSKKSINSIFPEENKTKIFLKSLFKNIFELNSTEKILYNLHENKLILDNNKEIYLFDKDNYDNYDNREDFDNSKEVSNSNFSTIEIDYKNILKKLKISSSDFNIKNNFINNFRILEICKYISLIFLFVDYKNNLDLKNQIRLSNLALNNETFIRVYLLKKIEKILLTKNSIYFYLNLIQILMLFLNDPEKELRKKATNIFEKFIEFVFKKFFQYKSLIDIKNKSYYYYYKYIPESYVTYIIMYIIFNPNLISLVQLQEKKYFQNLLKNVLKIIKKTTNGEFDSSFILEYLTQIKDIRFINEKKKFHSLINFNDNNTYLYIVKAKNKILSCNFEANNYIDKVTQFNFENYNNSKNQICDLAIDIIKLNFNTHIKNEKIKPLIPIIFYSKVDLNNNKIVFNSNSNIKYIPSHDINPFNFNVVNNFTLLNNINGYDLNNVETNSNLLLGNIDYQDNDYSNCNGKGLLKSNNNIDMNNFEKISLNFSSIAQKMKYEEDLGINNFIKKDISEINNNNNHELDFSNTLSLNKNFDNFYHSKDDNNNKKTQLKNFPNKNNIDENSRSLNLEKV